jgi:site-specific DNA-methyltransferase (adenine-specific)
MIELKKIDQIVLCNSSNIKKYVDDDTVSLVVTSPPYDVGKAYENEKESTIGNDAFVDAYLDDLDKTWRECWRVLKPGGRLVINIAGTWRQPYVPIPAYITVRLVKARWYMRGVIVWDKMNSGKRSTAWGSWMSPSNPYLRDITESILVFSKTNLPLKGTTEPDITRDEFLSFSQDIWRMETDSAKSRGHPAPFPLEFPKRAIKFYTYPGDLVIDPFNGSGTACEAAAMLGRHYMGFDIVQEYVDLARDRVAKYKRKAMY